MRSMYTRSIEHLNEAGVRATMDSKVEEQRSVIKFLLLEHEKALPHFSKVAAFFFLKPAYPV